MGYAPLGGDASPRAGAGPTRFSDRAPSPGGAAGIPTTESRELARHDQQMLRDDNIILRDLPCDDVEEY